jgi:hypothetical protein
MDPSMIALGLPLAVCLLWLGYRLAIYRMRVDHKRLEYQRAVLDAEWQQLDRVRRIRAAFFATRRAMLAELNRHMKASTHDRYGGRY